METPTYIRVAGVVYKKIGGVSGTRTRSPDVALAEAMRVLMEMYGEQDKLNDLWAQELTDLSSGAAPTAQRWEDFGKVVYHKLWDGTFELVADQKELIEKVIALLTEAKKLSSPVKPQQTK